MLYIIIITFDAQFLLFLQVQKFLEEEVKPAIAGYQSKMSIEAVLKL